MSKIYIAGAVSSDLNYKNKFNRAAALLQKKGHVVLSPAVLPAGLTTAEYMRLCFAMIDVAETVAFLPDWTESPGAYVEQQYCNYIGKHCSSFYNVLHSK